MNHPRSSRQRYRAFVEDYKRHRLDETIDGGRQISAPAGVASHAFSTKRREFLREYLRWLRPHRYAVGGLFLLALLVAGMQMVEPLFLRYVIDRVLLNRGLDAAARLLRLNVAGTVFLAVVVASNLLNAFKDYRQRLVNTQIMLSLRQSLFERMLHLPLPK